MIFLFFFHLMFFSFPVNQQSTPLTIHVMGIKEIEGDIFVAAYDNDKDFMGDNGIAGNKISIEQNTLSFIMELPIGEYAILIYQDLNRDGKLNTNFLGIPKEPYGASNGLGSFAVPNFKKSLLKIGSEPKSIEIMLHQ